FRVPKWTVTAAAVTAGLTWLSLTVTLGLCIAAGKCSYELVDSPAYSSAFGPLLRSLRSVGGFMTHFDAIGAMHAHAHLGGIGFFTVLIVGVSYKLIPMFTLSEVQNLRRAFWSVILLNAGLAASFVAILLRSQWKVVCAGVVIVALGLYGTE